MKKFLYVVFGATLILGCSPKVSDLATNLPINAQIDLVHVTDDKVKVEIDPGRITSERINFYIPKTVPGTYSDDNYGQYINDLVALDYNDKELSVTKVDENTWTITNATNLDKITYYVNDTFDTETEKEEPVFSPAGSNIDSGKNFFLNLHMFVGYFDNLQQRPYILSFIHPENMSASTSLTEIDTSDDVTIDTFMAERYFEVTDNPIMYSELDSESFKVNDIEVKISVFSPNKVYTAYDIKNDMEKMMKAQKAFLGEINSTKNYHILLYLSNKDMNVKDATGFGALEHHTSTTVVLPEGMPREALVDAMIDVVSHEFFHIVTPLSVHSKEVHNFDYNAPEMSKHLWMYEGVTEYFANLFQVNQGLIDEAAFYERIVGKVNDSKAYDDSMSFTEMSENILKEPYKSNYINVYAKGALIGMCIDIILREQSNGEKGILWLMKQLSSKYGKDNPFEDDKIIDEIVSITYPEVGDFFTKHVIGKTPINYEDFFQKVGLKKGVKTITTEFFFFDKVPYIDVNENNEIFFRNVTLSTSHINIGIQQGDIIKSINGEECSLATIQGIILKSRSWNPEDEITMIINRAGKEITLRGKLGTPQLEKETIVKLDTINKKQDEVRNAWLKN